jgi:hypothetical protein
LHTETVHKPAFPLQRNQKRISIARCRLSRPLPDGFQHALSVGDSTAGHPPKTSINPALVKTAFGAVPKRPFSGALFSYVSCRTSHHILSKLPTPFVFAEGKNSRGDVARRRQGGSTPASP